jgi:predicted nucleotidyltransferase
LYNIIVHIIDAKKFRSTLKDKGFRSIGDLAKSLGIHRNTIHHYLSGHGVLPDSFEKIIQALDLKPADILIEEAEAKSPLIEPIAPLVDSLHQDFPDFTFILFGSRPRGTAHKYSDWDLGVYSSNGLTHNRYRKILRRKDELVENLPFFVDIINLNRADEYFLKEASRHWMFLAGKLTDWIEIQKGVAT